MFCRGKCFQKGCDRHMNGTAYYLLCFVLLSLSGDLSEGS